MVLQSLQKWKKPGYRFVQQPGYVMEAFLLEDKDGRQKELSAERLYKIGLKLSDPVRFNQAICGTVV